MCKIFIFNAHHFHYLFLCFRFIDAQTATARTGRVRIALRRLNVPRGYVSGHILVTELHD